MFIKYGISSEITTGNVALIEQASEDVFYVKGNQLTPFCVSGDSGL